MNQNRLPIHGPLVAVGSLLLSITKRERERGTFLNSNQLSWVILPLPDACRLRVTLDEGPRSRDQ